MEGGVEWSRLHLHCVIPVFHLGSKWNLHYLFPPYLGRICRVKVGVREVQGSRLIFLTGCMHRLGRNPAFSRYTGILTSDLACR